MYELIITEKPSAAQKIAEALADGKPLKRQDSGVAYFEITHKKKPIRVACAVGHLYTVAEKDTSKGWTYPVFELAWEQSSKVNKGAAFTAEYVRTLKTLAKEANEFTVATDYDIEGEVIGMNVVTLACKQKDANRMKFSTLTKPDIVKAYEQKAKTLDWGQALAGKTRHELDWYFGINLSRALSLAVRSAGVFKVLSSGRVQGPALKILCDKEAEITAFIPTPYWEIVMLGSFGKDVIEALHKEEKILDQNRANQIMQHVTGATKGKVSALDANQFKQQPPFPFDLTSLQIECYRVHGIAPKQTLELAQELYIAGYISYPRTSSQQLPPEIGFKKILEALAKQETYATLAQSLSQGVLKPNNGPKTDEAHPAIYPTGITPAKLDDRVVKLYDLVVRRFLATFGQPAVRETVTMTILVKDEPFIAKGSRTVDKGWHVYYGKYVTFEEVTLPSVKIGDDIGVTKIEQLQKETKPPKRYTAASIIKELEKQNLGTKSTRATIIENLYDRGYVDDKSIEVTKLGLSTCKTLEKYSPKILDVELTREIEDEMEDIRKKKKTPEDVLTHARTVLTQILLDFKEKELSIGKELLSADRETRDASALVGTLPDQTQVRLLKGKFGMFIGSLNYPQDTRTFSLPAGLFKPSGKICKDCAYPTILKIMRAKAPQELCFNPACSGKVQLAQADVQGVGSVCPKCGVGHMQLRTSLYGKFLGCDKYPACKTIIKIDETGKMMPYKAAPATASTPKKAVTKKPIKKKK